MNKYRITKRGKIALYTISSLIIVLVVNLIFRLPANADNIIKRAFNDKASSQRITLLNKPSNSKEYEEKQNIIDSSTPDTVITAKTTSITESENSVVKSKIPSDEGIEVPIEVKAEATANKEESSYTVESAYVKDGKKVAFLTFDDGPSSENTPKILDILRSYNIKATFFIIGSAAEKNRDILKAVVNDGHAIGNHTYSHEYKTIYSSVPTFIGEIKKTNNIFKDILGSDFNTRIVRFPGGAFQTPAMKPFISELNNEGFVSIDWNTINGDGEGLDIPEDKLVKKVKDTALNQSHLVVLMHDSATKQTSVKALPQIIEYLKAEAYEFATLR